MDVVIVETVGSGQVDVEIREVASTSVVVVVPHLGDEVQSLKAGLFEIADVFCVNKSDLPGADLAAKDLGELVGLGPGRDAWRPAVVTTSTTDGRGLDDLWSAVDAHEKFLDRSGLRAAADRRRLAQRSPGWWPTGSGGSFGMPSTGTRTFRRSWTGSFGAPWIRTRRRTACTRTSAARGDPPCRSSPSRCSS